MNEFESHIRKYWREVVEIYARDGTTEHTGRSALEMFLNACAQRVNKNLVTIHEPKKREGKAPDFVIKKGELFLGYIEVKNSTVKLDSVLRSEQIKGYLQLSKNLLVTNYESWAFFLGQNKETGTLMWKKISLGLLNRVDSLNENKVKDFSQLLEIFFKQVPERIGHVKIMALALAARAKRLKETLSMHGRLEGLYNALKKQVSSDLTVDVFKDAYAQTVVYGLFLARLNAPPKDEITLINAKKYIASSFPVIKELTDFLYELDEKKYNTNQFYAEEILAIINNLDLPSIQNQLSFRNYRSAYRGVRAQDEEEFNLFARDPFVYFYEDFLAAYDKEKRKARGVYFTPPPIVHFIVKSVEEILQDKKLFNINDGLADREKVTLLDFATGTGTFLAEVIKVILEKQEHKDNIIIAIEEHILKNIFGFEFLIAPYVVAHLKLTQVLKEYNYDLKNLRIPVYLANTLETERPQKDLLLPALTAEAEKAKEIKGQKILIITGNPPYNVHPLTKDEVAKIKNNKRSNNKNHKELLSYKEIVVEENGQKRIEKLNEIKHWLNDDYVRFIEFAQKKIDQLDQGIVAIITNHAFINNRTFRLMRQSLMNSFDQIYILDLHGSSRITENPPHNLKNENVFDIQQGVAVSFFIKKPGIEKGIYHAEFWGTRRQKYKKAVEESWKTLNWKKIIPQTSFGSLRLFVPRDGKHDKKYEDGWILNKIFPVNSSCITTACDKLTIQHTKEEMRNKLKGCVSIETEELRKHFSLKKDGRDWKLNLAQQEVLNTKMDENFIKSILYRPFDKRVTYYTGENMKFICWPRYNVMRHMLKDNLGLVSCRQCSFGNWRHVFVANSLTESCFISNKTKEVNYLFPMYLYRPQENERAVDARVFDTNNSFQNKEKIENIFPEFRKFINNRYKKTVNIEEIFSYIYSILHDKNYRDLYEEYTKYDFPRIPFPVEYHHFCTLSELGKKLIDTHLIRHPLPSDLYVGVTSNRTITKIQYDSPKNRLYINNDNYFKNITPDIYDFHIGSYKVLEKYLKERKKRPQTIFSSNSSVIPSSTLQVDEIAHISQIILALSRTQELMKEISKITSLCKIYS